jgi:murein DD-endopeptidase MepM/ murein hydrolase activator NlpD
MTLNVRELAFALTPEQKKLIDSGAGYTEPFGQAGPCSTDGRTAGNRIYVIGDSLTVGMRDFGELESKLTAKAWSVTGIQATTGINVANSIPKIDEDSAKVASSNVVLIMLGTNRENNLEEQIKQMISKVKTVSPSAKIYWMNAHTNASNYDDVNGVIDSQSTALGYQAINWKAWYLQNPTAYPFSADNIHHTAEGFKAKADFLVGALGTAALQGDDFSGGNNVEIAYRFFISKTLTAEQSAGIVGNLIAESGVEPTRQQYGGGPGRGIAQWEVGARWDQLVRFANAQSIDPLSIQTQLQYLWWEFTNEPELAGLNGGAEKRAYQDIIAQTTVAGAASSFMLKFERPADQSPAAQAKRAALAQPVFDQYSGTASSGGGGGSNSVCATSNTATVSIDGFFFPLEATKAIIQAGGANATGEVLKWNPTCQENCHHDYNAADIHAEPGTKVVAAKSGVVVSTREKLGSTGSHVTIMGEDGVLYFYVHLGYKSITVTDNATVAGGQVIGEVGDSNQAAGTAAHLHFDALPGDQFKQRPNCASAACSGYPFINVAPILSKLYEELPE